MKRLIFCIFSCALTLFGDFVPFHSAAASEGAAVYLYFYEAGTDFSVRDVCVVVPETKQKFWINNGGNIAIEGDFSAVTLLFYKEGYADTAVFHFPLCGKKTAKYALYRACKELPFVVYAETPNSEDVLSILNAYRPWAE